MAVSDPFDPDSDLSVDAETFQQWVTHTAESRGVDEHELLNQLVSAFWVLDEMSDVAAGVEKSGGSSVDDELSGRSHTTDHDLDQGRKTQSNSTPDHGSDTQSDTTSPTTEPQSDSNADSDDTDISREIDELRESLRTEMDLFRTVTELRRQVADLSIDVEQQRSRQEQFTDRLSDDITRLHSRIEEIDEGANQADSEIQSKVMELQQDVTELESTNDEFESWIDEEFDEIEALFNQLIDTTQQLDTRLNEVETTVDTVVESEESRTDLSDLRRTAQELNVDSGRCDNCDTKVDLSMLTEPACPSCEKTFTGVTAGSSWNPFSDSVLRTRPKASDSVPPANFE